MADLVDRLWTLVRHGREQGMKMNDVEDAACEIARLRKQNIEWRKIVENLESQINGLRDDMASSSATSKER